jgi:hypothetical protein
VDPSVGNEIGEAGGQALLNAAQNSRSSLLQHIRVHGSVRPLCVLAGQQLAAYTQRDTVQTYAWVSTCDWRMECTGNAAAALQDEIESVLLQRLHSADHDL